MEYIKIGQYINTHGIKGEIKINSISDFDAERYRKGNTVYLLIEEQYVPFIVHSYRSAKGYAYVSFEKYLDINLIEKYKGSMIFFNAEDRKPLRDGRHYADELIGMQAVDEENHLIGIVKDVEKVTEKQKNLRIERVGMNDALVPMIPIFIKEVNDSEKKIVIKVQEGLL